MFRGVAIVHGTEHWIGPHAQAPAERSVGVMRAEDPATPVEIDHDVMRASSRRAIQAIVEIALRARKQTVNNLTDLRARRAHDGKLVGERARAFRRHLIHRRKIERSPRLKHHLNAGLHHADNAVVYTALARTRANKAQVVSRDYFVARSTVCVDAPDVGQEHSWLARNISSHVPGIGRRE